jgi:hypothetical protein
VLWLAPNQWSTHVCHVLAAPASEGTSQMKKFLLIVFGIVGFIIFAGHTLVQQDRAREQANPTCKSDWEKCKDNSDLANHWEGFSGAQVDCQYATNDRAKYDTPKYTSGYPGYFSSFRDGDSAIKTGKMLVIDKDVKMQNGFGAVLRVRPAEQKSSEHIN